MAGYKGSSLFYCGIVGVLLAVVVYLALQQYSTLLNEEDFADPESQQTPSLDSTIKRIQYDVFNVSIPIGSPLPPKNLNLQYDIRLLSAANLEETLRDVVNDRLPYVLTDSVASKWKALKWNIWDLAASDKWPILKNVLSLEGDNVIVTETERDVGGMIGGISSMHRRPTVIPEMYFADFLYDVRNSTNKLFYSTNYRVLESIAKLEGDTTWKDFNVVEYILSSNNITLDQIAPLLNLLYPGAVLQTRYSEYHTVKTQIKGSTRITLFAPEHLKDLSLYPSIHLSHQQSQVDLYSQEMQNLHFPRYKAAARYVTTLQPGQSLYVPPYWSMHQEAERLSVSLDVLSASQEQLWLTTAYQMPLPFGKVQTKEERIVGAQVYLVHVLSRIAELTTIKKYASMLYKSRYSVLYPEKGLFLLKNTFQCYKDQPDLHSSLVDKLDKYKVLDRADAVAKVINDKSVSAAIRWLWMGNFVEQIARWAMGDPNQAVHFIRECLDFDGKLEVVEDKEGPKVMKLNPE